MADHTARPSLWIGISLLAAVTFCVFAIRLSGPSDLLDNDQLRPAAYALDVIVHNRWAVQTDFGGDIASKPPLYTWLVGLASLPDGRVTLLTLYLPCAVAVLAAAAAVYGVGRRVFGSLAGFLAGSMIVLSAYGFKHVALARTDAVFMATVCLTALLTWRAWSIGCDPARSRGACTQAWTLAWIAAGFAILTKGPLGMALGAMGLLAILWERRGGHRSDVRGTHWLGAAACVALAGGWFIAAYATAGDAFIDKVIGRELVGHVVGASKEHLPEMSIGERLGVFALGLGKPSVYLFTRFLPWSVLTLIGLWRVVKRPSVIDEERRCERFATCWLIGGIGLFSVMPHQRADLLLPLVPAAALLAGREAAMMLDRVRHRAKVAIVTAVALIALCGGVYEYHVRAAGRQEVQRSVGVQIAARRVSEFLAGHPGVRVIDIDASGGMQFFLGIKEPRVALETAAEVLRGEEPVVVLTRDLAALETALGEPPTVVTRWPDSDSPFVAAVTNLKR